MASEASWQTSTAGKRDPFAAAEPMDQRTVESLLRRLVDRVEESERRYGEALDELHARLDQLSQTTEAARETGVPEDADTFDRLHTQVSDLARRLERENAAPLDDFERLGRALSNSFDQSASQDEPPPELRPYGGAPEPSPFAQSVVAGHPFVHAATAAKTSDTAKQGLDFTDFDYDLPEEPVPAVGRTPETDYTDLDKRLVEMAHRLEQSIGSAMPTSAIESLNTRLDDISGQLNRTLERAPTREAIEHIERQISDMSQQFNRAEEQLGKVAGIEAHLIELIERLGKKTSAQSSAGIDHSQIEAIANVAATEAARLIAGEANKSAERIDAHLVKLAERVDEKSNAQVSAETDQTQIKAIANAAATEVTRLIAGEANKSAERIDAHLVKLIERVEENMGAHNSAGMDQTQIKAIANAAATEVTRLIAEETNKSAERIDALQRDISAMSTKSSESGDRLVSTLEAVHESLKQLVQQVERGAEPARQPKARMTFAERVRQSGTKPVPPHPVASAGSSKAADQPAALAKTEGSVHGAAASAALRDRLRAAIPNVKEGGTPQLSGHPECPSPDEKVVDSAKTAEKPAGPAKTEDSVHAAADSALPDPLHAAIPEFKEPETPRSFGRAKRLSPDEEAVDLDAAAAPRKSGMRADAKPAADASMDAPDDLVAAARRAAQAAALRAEERGGRRLSSVLPGSGPAEQPGRRKRSVLIIAAAVLLALSAVLLYSRLGSKSETEATAPASEETTPAPSDTESTPSNDETAPATPATPDQSGAWEPVPGYLVPNEGTIKRGEASGVTDIAKSRAPAMPQSELAPEPQLASLTPAGTATLPPGVIFSIEEPAAANPTRGIAVPSPETVAAPAKLEMPPAGLGPLALRQAAAHGDAAAQYVIAVNYAEGKGTKADLTEAATWLERAATTGFAPAQYRLAAMYERGIGVDKDIAKARSWYLAAAERGNVKAMHNLAVSLSGRDGGEADYAQAAKWYRAAATHGLADSQFNLGILAEHGLGMTKNLTEAYQWFALAAAQGDAEAAKRREVVRVQLAPETLAEAEAAVKAWKADTAATEANDVAEQPAWTAAGQDTQVTRAQTLLNKLGYDVGPPDGIAGERTRSAILLFERRNGLQETGAVSSQLIATLERLAS